jgi:uncharacterized FlaG/YvyC family protein
MDPMSDYTISPIGQQRTASAEPLPTAKRSETKPAEKKKQEPVEARQPETESGGQTTAAKIAAFRVQFQVDPKTSDVVILITDQASNKVVRTIPAEAIKDLPPGQVLDTFS